MLSALCADPRNIVYIISGRGRTELDAWFGSVVRLGWGLGCTPARVSSFVIEDATMCCSLVDSQ